MIRDLITNRENWDDIAVIEEKKRVSYRELAQRAVAIQKHLPQARAGAAAILLPNGSDYMAALWGVMMAGIAAFPLNAAMTKHEIVPLLVQASAHTVITSNKFRALITDMAGHGETCFQPLYVEELVGSPNDDFPLPARVDADEPMVLLSTSGTTGGSKIVQLSEVNIAASVSGYIEKMDFGEFGIGCARFILAVPFSSAYGIMILAACLMNSFPIVLLKDHFTLDMLYQTAEAHKATHYEGSASTIQIMAQMAGRAIPYDISLFRHFGFGGSKVSGDTIKALLRAYPWIELLQGYGMTEAAPLITKFHWAKPIKPDSVGTAIKGLEIAVEVDGVLTDAPYAKGEIAVRGPNVMLGYYQNEAETSKVLRDGYLHTGDIGYLDEDGYLFICGRKKNVIIVRGFTVHPEEVEECILGSTLALDCFVYGQADAGDNDHETVCADIVPAHPQLDAEEIRAYCATHLAEYKQPQSIRICEEISKNTSGKTERFRRK